MSDESTKVDDKSLTQLLTIKPGTRIQDIESAIESLFLIKGARGINLFAEEDKLAAQEFDNIMEQVKLSTIRIDKDQEEIARLRQETRLTIENLTALIK